MEAGSESLLGQEDVDPHDHSLVRPAFRSRIVRQIVPIIAGPRVWEAQLLDVAPSG